MKHNVRTPFTYQGSKLAELKYLNNYIPTNSKIIEPFIGTGIVSYKFGKDRECLGNDLNPDIYHIWKYTKEINLEFFSLIEEYMQEENRSKEYYYSRRDEFNQKYWKAEEYTPKKSALFYFLINSAHAGLTRYSKNGFNVGIKLFLLNGRLYNIKQRIKLLKSFSKKFTRFDNMNAIDYLKSIENRARYYDVVYCDPPYVNSDIMYVDRWTNDNLLELDDYLFYLNKKYNTYSVLQNYDSDIKYKGNISFSFVRTRMARTKLTKSNNIIVTYGSIPKKDMIDCLY